MAKSNTIQPKSGIVPLSKAPGVSGGFIYFGDKNDPFMPIKGELNPHDSKECIRSLERIAGLTKASQLTFLKQVHGTDVFVVEDAAPRGRFLQVDLIHSVRDVGDALVTSSCGHGLCVMTADCLPIVLYDFVRGVAAVVHAGWRGTVMGIVGKTLAKMQKQFGTLTKDVKAYFGPSAGSCCYEVKQDFYDNFCKSMDGSLFSKRIDDIFVYRNNKMFFDNSRLNYLQLLSYGVSKCNINDEHNQCTICKVCGGNFLYHSYRRDGILSGRQVTVVVLSV